MSKQVDLFGSLVLPTSKRVCIREASFKESWYNSALWPVASGLSLHSQATLPTTWLKYVEEPEPGMFCLLCQKYNKVPRSGNAFWTNTPCTLIRSQSVQRHAKSSMHSEASQQEIERQLADIDGGVAGAFQRTWEAEEKAICAAISCVYFLAREEIPHMTKYKPLLELVSHLGMPYLDTLHKGENATSTSHRIIDEFLSILGESVRTDVVTKIRMSPCFSIICDETTDLSTTKQLIIYIKAVSVNNCAATYFLSLKELPECDANSIVTQLRNVLEEYGLDMAKCFGIGSDGAAVMTGQHNGVSAQLKALQPSIISIHCVAHKLALAVSQAARIVSPVQRFKNCINSLFVFFHGSPKRQGRLRECFQILENKPALKLRKPADTRWLACEEAVQVVKKSLQPLAITLEELSHSGDATALGLATLLKRYEFIAGVFFMAEILPILSRLSKTFQLENLNFASVKPALDRAKASLSALRLSSNSNAADWQKELSEWQQENSHLTGHNAFLTTFVLPFIDAVEMNLLARFPENDINVLSAADVFQPSNIPDNLAECYSYGRDCIKVLAEHYCCDITETTSEWKEVVHTLKKTDSVQKSLEFLIMYRSQYPNLGKIASALMVIPMHSADCERGFSALG